MSVSDGEKVNAAVTNAAFISRTSDSNTTGVLALDNVSSGGTIANAQQQINDNEATGTTNAGNIASNTGNIATNTADIATNASDILDRILLTEKGAINGVATLDGSGRMPSTQLPTSATEYKGAWDANTNSPALADGVGTNGDLYRISVAGSQDLGSGSISFGVGDAIIYNGTIWERIPADDAVTSVNTQTGVVVLDTDDVSEGVNKYANGSIDTHSDVDTTSVAPTDGQVLTWVNANSAWENKAATGGGTANDISTVDNASLATSVAASALTIDLKQLDGSTDPTALSPVTIAMRSSTLTSSSTLLRTVTGALSIVIPSGATIGHGNADDGYIYIYAIDNAGTVELALSSSFKPTTGLVTTTAITAASDDDGFYSTVARASVPARLIGRMQSNQTTAGTWAVVPFENKMLTPDMELIPRDYVENVRVTDYIFGSGGPGVWRIPDTGFTQRVQAGTWRIRLTGRVVSASSVAWTGILNAAIGTSTTPGSGLLTDETPFATIQNLAIIKDAGGLVFPDIVVNEAQTLYLNIIAANTFGTPAFTATGFGYECSAAVPLTWTVERVSP